MKEKKHVGGLAEFVALDLENLAHRAQYLLDTAPDEASLRQGFERLAQDLEGVAAISLGAVAGRIMKAAKEESTRMGNKKRGHYKETVNKEAFIQALAEVRGKLDRAHGEVKEVWKKMVAKRLGASVYHKVIAPRLAEWGLSEESVERYMTTGVW